MTNRAADRLSQMALWILYAFTAAALIGYSTFGVHPELMSELYVIASRLLPGPGGIGTDSRLGRQSESALTRSFLTLLTRHAAARNNESALKPFRLS